MRALATLPRPRDVLREFGVYVHIPFCSHRCWYCDFNAYAGLDDLAPRYMAALREHALRAGVGDERPVVTSVFFGGGTPSLVDAGALRGVLDAIRDSWPVDPRCEVTVECNPESADASKLERYLDGGVTRVSFGVQSLDDALLARLGRVHDADTALAAIRRARRTGFEDVSADLIFGIPGEDDARWRHSIESVVAEGVTHLSCYGLTYEEGTPLHAWRRLGKVVPVPDDDVARRWELACGVLARNGFERYEISNWALPGRRSRHNSLYWSCGEYLGLGAGAHSHVASPGGSVRSWTLRSPERYAAAVEACLQTMAGSEEIDADGRASEVLFLGLRRVEGVNAAFFRDMTGCDLGVRFGEQIARGTDGGLLSWDGERVALTDRGTLLCNEAVAPFLGP